MAAWFLILAIMGVAQIIHRPSVLLGLSPLLRGFALHDLQRTGVPGTGRGRSVRHRRGGALCRYGPFRTKAHSSELAVHRSAQPGAELFRPGRAAAAGPRRGGKSVLPDGAGMGPVAAGLHGDRGDRDRQSGGDLRRLFGDEAMHATWPAAATDGSCTPRTPRRARFTFPR